MKVPFAVIADGANASREGKLNILGIFDTLFAKSFPVTHPEMKLVIRVEGSAAEIGAKHTIEIKLLSSEGEAVLGMKAEMVPRSGPGAKRFRMDQVISLHNVVFKAAGQYEFAVLIDSDQKATVPLAVREAPAMPAGPGGGPGGGPVTGAEGEDTTPGEKQYH